MATPEGGGALDAHVASRRGHLLNPLGLIDVGLWFDLNDAMYGWFQDGVGRGAQESFRATQQTVCEAVCFGALVLCIKPTSSLPVPQFPT